MLISTGPGLLVLSDVSVLLVILLPYTEIFSFSPEVRRGCHCAYQVRSGEMLNLLYSGVRTEHRMPTHTLLNHTQETHV